MVVYLSLVVSNDHSSWRDVQLLGSEGVQHQKSTGLQTGEIRARVHPHHYLLDSSFLFLPPSHLSLVYQLHELGTGPGALPVPHATDTAKILKRVEKAVYWFFVLPLRMQQVS